MSDETSSKELLAEVHPSLPTVNILLSLPPVNELLGAYHTLHSAHSTKTNGNLLPSVCMFVCGRGWRQ